MRLGIFQKQIFILKRIVLCFFFGMSVSVHAQFQIPFINYTNDHGLIQNQISGICQDMQGYIWFATAEGISRFDGKNFKNFTVEDGLPTRIISAIHADRKNRIWIATQGGGLAMYDQKSFKIYGTQEGLASNTIMVIDSNPLLFEDSKGNMWCIMKEGISMIDNGNVLTFDQEQLGGMAICFVEDKLGRIVCGNHNGISVIDNGKISNYELGNGFGVVKTITTDNNGNVWIAGNNHIAKFSDNQLTHYPFDDETFTTCYLDSHNRLWLSTLDGIYIFDNGRLNHFSTPDGTVSRIFEDSKRNVWFQTFNNGVYRFNNQIVAHYTSQSGLAGDQVTSFLEDTEGNVWIGTTNGVSMYGKVIFELLTTVSGLPNNHILSVAADNDGNVWCGPQSGGLVMFDGQKIKQSEFHSAEINKEFESYANTYISMATAKNQLLLGAFFWGMGQFVNGRIIFNDSRLYGIDVNDILTTDDGEFWLATSHGLIHQYGLSTDMYNKDNGLADDLINFIVRDENGKIWCTTSMGLSVFDGKQFTTYTMENGLPNNSCTDIAIDKYGVVWVGTDDGLCRISEKNEQIEFKTYTIHDGLASNSISLVHADQSEKLWIGHVNGLNTIDLETGKIEYYNREDGYLPMDCYQGAATTDTHGNVWFGTIGGLVKYIPDADIKRSTPPRTYITGISLINDDMMQFTDSISSANGLPVKLSLPHDKNVIRIDWIGIHYTIPSKIRYRYILDRYEKTWHEASIETSREYSLSPGTYTFKVMACNNDGVWNEEPVSYSFTIRPPWWATIMAYVVYAIIVFIAIYLYIRWRERSLREKNRILEDKVYERTLEIELQKQNILAINNDLKEYQEELIIQRDMAAAQRDKIDAQRTEIMDSIRYAKRIQKAIMPKPEVLSEIIPDHFLLFRPRNIVSGDYFWAARKDGKSVVVAADCTGHGVPGAFMSMLGISVLNDIVLRQEINSASTILDTLRTNLKSLLSQTGATGEQRDGMDMALCIIDNQAMELQYAGAYNSVYMVRNKELIEYRADKMPVGIHIGAEKPFTNYDIKLERDDMLYIYSDGYVDQFGGPNDEKFKKKPFKQLLVDISDLPSNQQKEILVKTHDDWKGEKAQVDDIIIIGIRISDIS